MAMVVRNGGHAANAAPAPATTIASSATLPSTMPAIAGTAAPKPLAAAVRITTRLFGPGVIAAMQSKEALANNEPMSSCPVCLMAGLFSRLQDQCLISECGNDPRQRR